MTERRSTTSILAPLAISQKPAPFAPQPSIERAALVLNDLPRVTAFHENVVGLRQLRADRETVLLGAGSRALLELRRDASARRARKHEAGLYHTAFLLPDRQAPAGWLRHAIDMEQPLLGSADHEVNEALYLADPEGNGIEIYADRSPSEWRWRDGLVDMPNGPLDIEDLLRQAKIGGAKDTAAIEIGHVHLQVGEIEAAERFDAGTLGLDVTSRYPAGTFFAVGEYHHRLVTNCWNSRGAGRRVGPTTGLAEVEIRFVRCRAPQGPRTSHRRSLGHAFQIGASTRQRGRYEMIPNERPADIISPITDSALTNRVPVADARAAGCVGYNKPTADNSILLLVDHQIGLMTGMRDTTSLTELKSNVIGLARTAKALGIPTLVTSSNAQWQNGDNLPEIKEFFSNQPIYRRTGIINCYEDPTFGQAIEKLVERTGRRHVIIAAVTIGTCCALPTLSMLNDGYAVYPVVDACGAWNRYEADAAMSRMARAGAELVTTFALACELQADWKRPTAEAMLGPFIQNLPEYGFLIQNFWNTANRHTVVDPFGTVK